jgi:hypothetical protein
MPVILTQHYSPADRIYEDVEYSLYHYPRQYFGRIEPYDRFIYYRPLGRSATRADSKTYFGHGVLGQWFSDPNKSDHRFVPLIQADSFPHPVPIYDSTGAFYESESATAPQFQSAVRTIGETAYWRILSVGGVKTAGISMLPSTELIGAQPYPTQPLAIQLDELRRIEDIPSGAGYKPKGDNRVNVFESAALQERARADHQRVLRLIQLEVQKRGGETWYNNNIDLFATFGEARLLIEAKSLNDLRAAVDRMRYGIGQLADYDFRYRAKLRAPQKVLAFGALPTREVSWIADVLEDQRIAFVASDEERLLPLNSAARSLSLFE